MNRMTPEDAQAWIDELESGKYIHGKRRLQNKDGSMCCLGVLADMHGNLNVRGGWEYSGSESNFYLINNELGLSLEDQNDIGVINDAKSTKDFTPVIQKIRELYIDN